MTKCSRSLTLFIEPSLVIQLKEDNQLLISFLVSNYRNEAYTSSNESPLSSVSSKIDDDPSFIPGRTTTYGTGIPFFALVLEQRKLVQRQAGWGFFNLILLFKANV